MTFNNKPIVVTMGEPSGISSEIIIKAWLKRNEYNIPPFILIDDLNRLNQIKILFNFNVNFHILKPKENLSEIFNNSIPLIDLRANISLNLGSPDKKNSEFVIQSINKAFELTFEKKASAMLTLPVCKKTLKKAKFNFNGQTEYLSYLTNKRTRAKDSEIMILTTTKPIDRGKNLIVGLITTHLPLGQIHRSLKKELVFNKILSFKNSLSKIWKIRSPKIAITSINPHAGEGGFIGNEEITILKPVLKKFDKLNINIVGPLSGDSCFHKSSRERFDGILCIYHDQGLIPVKTLDFKNSINITGGLPFIRVSPDHGPAFDIAKQNIADINSLIASFHFIKRFA